MRLEEDAYALALPLSLAKPGYLLLMIWDDNTLNASQSDPLAGIIGVLASATRSAGEGGGGERLVIRPAEENTGARGGRTGCRPGGTATTGTGRRYPTGWAAVGAWPPWA